MLARVTLGITFLFLAACGGAGEQATEPAPPPTDTAGSGDRLPPDSPPGGDPGEGTLTGKVTFVGTPCQQPGPPPCDGPYPNYEVIVYAADGTTEVARTRTGADGSFDLTLREGDYVIFTPAGPMEKDRARTVVHVGRDALEQVELRVDTGVR